MDSPKMCPSRWLSDQNFGMCITPHDFLYPFYEMNSNYYRPWKWYNQVATKEFGSTIDNEKGNYKITLDVQHFRPNEINVKVTNNEIIVEGKHEERPDTHGFITRQFKRRYPLPSHCPSENVTSTLSADGILTIIAEKISSMPVEKIVPIKMCGMYPGKAQEETKIISETSQKECVKETEDVSTKIKSQVFLKEDHSRMLKPEFIKETITETNGTCLLKPATKEAIDVMKPPEKAESLNISSTSNKIEESIGKSIMGLTALTEQLGNNTLASTSGACGIKNNLGICATKDASNKYDIKGTSDLCAIKGALDVCGASEICGMKSTSESCEMKGISESGIKATSKTLIEESSSSYKSSSSTMTSSKRISGQTECVSDIISAELKEAAENV